MSTKNIKNARAISSFVLNKLNFQRDYAADILNKYISEVEVTSEKQRATDLVYGCLRNLSMIDHCISTLADCPIKRIQSKILNILRPAVYELVYCPWTADYAIVNESVRTAKNITGRKQTAFVNAVLRQITRHIKNREAELQNAEQKKVVPQNEMNGCFFDTEILPDIEEHAIDYFSLAFSLPSWLIKNWLEEYGLDSTRQICFASNRRPRIWIRPNLLKTTTEKLTEKLEKNGIEYQLPEEKTMVQIKGGSAVKKLPGFSEGEFIIQDLTAAHAVTLLNPKPGERILDLCAAPGTKTTQLAEWTCDKAEIAATDISTERLKMVVENIKRLGIKSVTIKPYEEIEKEAQESELFDKILLDVPCSNTGVLCKRIEVRFRIIPDAIEKLSKTQLGLLKSAVNLLKPDGKICYSTCSIQPEENSLLIRKFLEGNKDFELENERLILPSTEQPDHDGGYIAIITRK
ncbi:MAG: 16S rRNA (cytosine(967)-C(5))-methyltransferase RsmB [Planctomycetota bacterium]|jgi:16S rRNA (cytosine967-C5)-methyltransferase